MSLATSCPSCGTVFRVVQDQLKISEGWVRCGNCQEVFNALEGLFDLDRRDPSAPPASGMATPATDDPNDPSWAETRPAMFANVTPRSHAAPAEHDPFDPPPAHPSPDQGPWLNKPQAPVASAPEALTAAGQPSFSTQPSPPLPASGAPRTGRLHMPAEAGPDSLLSVSEFSEFAQDPDEHPTHYPTTTLEFRSEAFSAFAAARLRQTPGPETAPPSAPVPQPQGLSRPAAAPPLFDASPAAVDTATVFPAATPETPAAAPQAAPEPTNTPAGTSGAYLTAAGFLTSPSTPVPPLPPAVGTSLLSAQALLEADDDTPVYTPEDDPFEKTQDLSALQPSRFNSSPESYIPTDITLEGHQNKNSATASTVDGDRLSAMPALETPAAQAQGVGGGWLKKRRQAAAQSARDAEAERGFSTLESELAYAQHHEGGESILPDFIRQANNQARWQQPHVRAGLAVLAGVLGLTLVGQLAYQSRDTLAARWPQTQSVLEALCAVTGCELEPPRQLDALVVDSTTLTRPPGVDAYVLGVNLHNRAAHMIAAPHIELSLNDAAGNVVIRRVLTPAEFRQGNMLPAQSDASWNLTFSSPDRRISGYTLAAFYP